VGTIIIEGMSKLNIWLRWAICVFVAGLVISLVTLAIVKAAVAGYIVLSPSLWWGVRVGLVCSWLCPVAGVVLAVKGLIMFKKRVVG